MFKNLDLKGPLKANNVKCVQTLKSKHSDKYIACLLYWQVKKAPASRTSSRDVKLLYVPQSPCTRIDQAVSYVGLGVAHPNQTSRRA